MPLYYFNLFNGDVTMADEGLAFAGSDEALAHAVKEVRALAADGVKRGHFNSGNYIEVQDQRRRRVGVVRFDEAVEIRNG